MCHEIYELDPDRFLTTPGLARQAAFKKNKVKLDLLTDTHMLSMAVKKRRNISRYSSISRSLTNT